MKKKILASLLAGALTVSMLAGCAGNPDKGSKDSSDSGDKSGLNICILTADGTIDDGSYNENCYDGIVDFIDENPDATVKEVNTGDLSQCIQAVQDTIADYDVLVLPGYNFAAIGEIAADNPDKDIILVDSAVTNSDGTEVELDNVYSMTFTEQESGFLAGIAAALETKTGKVAVVNGIAYPSNTNYQFGFESGVNYVNAKYGSTAELVELPSYAGTDMNGENVGGNYIGSFSDVATGKVIGDTLIDQGVDIIFVAAGAGGMGVFTSAKESTDAKVIGVDVDQYDDGVNGDSNIILTSALKKMDVVVYNELNLIKEGKFEGKNEILSSSTDSVGIVTEEGRQQLSQGTIDKLNESYDLMKEGTVVPASGDNGYTPDDFPGLK